MHQYDVAVIGFGKAGKTIAIKRAKAGDRVVLFECDPKMYGGTCINIGCVPTKTLITAVSEQVRAYRTLEMPLEAEKAWQAARARRDKLINAMNQANLKMVETAGVTVVTGCAHFLDANTITCNDQSYRAETIIINTGAQAARLEVPGADRARVHDSTSIQFLPQLPARLAIIGAGPIALEFAGIFRALQVEVTLLDAAPQFLSRFDRDVASAVLEHLQGQGINCCGNVKVSEIVDREDHSLIQFDGPSGREQLAADAILVAIGRRPATAALRLDAAGVDVDERGAIKVDEHLYTGVAGIYAVGDVNGGPQFTYISFDDHRIVLAHRWGVEMAEHANSRGRVIPTSTFLDPPLSTVGASEAELKNKGINYRVATAKIADIAVMPRPKIVANATGLAKFLIGSNEQILGATLWCVDSQELINTVALAIAHEVTAPELGRMILTHPASSEVFNGLL